MASCLPRSGGKRHFPALFGAKEGWAMLGWGEERDPFRRWPGAHLGRCWDGLKIGLCPWTSRESNRRVCKGPFLATVAGPLGETVQDVFPRPTVGISDPGKKTFSLIRWF